MRNYRRFLLLLLAGVLVLVSANAMRPPQTVEAASGRQVFAYYFGWYSMDSWSDGRLIDHPAPPYASADGGTIGRQIQQAQSAGIDAFVMSWFGPKNGNLTHIVFNALLDQAAAHGFHAAASLDMGEGGYNSNTGEVLDSLRYLINDRANHPAYLRYRGKPLIYFWNEGRFPVTDWANMRAQVDPHHNTIWVMEGTDTSYLKVFDGLYLFNIAWSGGSAAGGWMGRTYAAGGSFYSPTVMPGWDESRITGRTNPTAAQARAGGAFLRNMWYSAAGTGADAILIVSWNEFLENSYIEPSQTFGTQALDTLRPLISAWKGHGPSVAAQSIPAQSGAGQPNAGQPASAAPSGMTLEAAYDSVKVRSGPGTNYDQIGEIHQGQVYPVLGRSSGWYQITVDGKTGYVAGGFVKIQGH